MTPGLLVPYYQPFFDDFEIKKQHAVILAHLEFLADSNRPRIVNSSEPENLDGRDLTR